MSGRLSTLRCCARLVSRWAVQADAGPATVRLLNSNNLPARGLAASSWQAQKTYLDELASAKQDQSNATSEGAQPPDAAESSKGQQHGSTSSDIERALQQAEAEGGMDAILQVVERFSRGADMDSKQVAKALRLLAKAASRQGVSKEALAEGLHPSPAFNDLVDMALATACRMSSKEISEAIAAAGRLGFGDQMLCDTLAQRMMGKGITSLEPQQLVDMVEGLQGADHSPGKVLFDELRQRLLAVHQRLSPEQKHRVRRAFQHFDYMPPF